MIYNNNINQMFKWVRHSSESFFLLLSIAIINKEIET